MFSFLHRALLCRPFRYIVGACGLVILGLMMPPDAYPDWFSQSTGLIRGSDKVIHALLFTAFFLFVVKYSHWKILTIFWGCIVFSGITELLQMLTPERTPSVADFLYDALGVTLGYLLWLRHRQRKDNVTPFSRPDKNWS